MKKKCHIPFDPSKFPIFYGWIILAAGTIGILMSIPGQTMGVSVFTENLLSDLHINRNNLSLAYLFGTVGSGLLITRAGKLYDRYGARIMALVAAAMLGLMLLYLTRVDVLVDWINRTLPWIKLSVGTFLLMCFGFWGIRFFGQGLLTMTSRNMVMKWFDKRRGFVNGILGLFVAFGFSLAPKLFSESIERYEWKGTWLLFAVIIGIGFVLFLLVFYRDNPQDCGCVADGGKVSGKPSKRPPSLPERDSTLPEARRTLAFWAFTLALSLTTFYISGMTFHIISVFGSAGLPEEVAIRIFVPSSLIAILFQFLCGYLSDYIRLKYLLMVFLTGMVTTTSGLILLGSFDPAYWMIIAGNGIVWGLYTVLVAVTWPRFYGLKNLGAISGFSLSISVIASALGPYTFSLSKHLTSQYKAIGWLCLGIALILLMISFRADNPSETTITSNISGS